MKILLITSIVMAIIGCNETRDHDKLLNIISHQRQTIILMSESMDKNIKRLKAIGGCNGK